MLGFYLSAKFSENTECIVSKAKEKKLFFTRSLTPNTENHNVTNTKAMALFSFQWYLSSLRWKKEVTENAISVYLQCVK